jgi:quercetin dioxygenase-like cupin family protein
MKIRKLDCTSSDPGPAAWFTGQTWIEELGRLDLPTPTRVLRVTFAPGARTEWHSHPHGQVLHILDGVARIGRAGEAVEEAHAGDSVEFIGGEMHWHGAGPGRLMTFLAVQATDVGGVETTWGEKVTEADYGDAR